MGNVFAGAGFVGALQGVKKSLAAVSHKLAVSTALSCYAACLSFSGEQECSMQGVR